MKKRLLTLISLPLILAIATACTSAAPTPVAAATATIEPVREVQDVTFNELFSSPDQYNGRDVVLTGFYFHGFETIVLSEKLEFTRFADGHLWPRVQMVWIEGSIPKGVYDQLYQQEMIGPLEHYGKLRIKGRLEHLEVTGFGNRYGHAGAFGAQIVSSEVELLPWSPLPLPDKSEGIITGSVTIGPLCPVEPCAEPIGDVYASRELLLRQEGREPIRIPLGPDGSFAATKIGPGTKGQPETASQAH